MTTWTDSARTTLEGHLARLRDGLASSGADPTEVADDLRRHIDEEVAARQIGVVTTEDVESILQRLGLPSSFIAAPGGFTAGTGKGKGVGVGPEASPSGTPIGAGAAVGPGIEPGSTAGARPSKSKRHPALLIFGVLLPLVTLLIELVTHMCASAFFDPIPGFWDVLLVASVPLVNWWLWRTVRTGRLPVMGAPWLGVASAYGLAVAAYYSLLYAPLSPFAAFAIIFFGWGLLPLSPILAFISAWRLRVLAGRIPGVEGQGGLRGWIAGLAVAVMAMGLVVLPPVLTRHWSHTVANGEPEASARALRWLRVFGQERTLLSDCYGGNQWGRDNPFHFHAQGAPIPADMARHLFYRVTGHAFNEFPAPQLRYSGRGWDVLGELEWDDDQGGKSVGGRLRGLSLGQSRLDGMIDGDAGWSYTEWVLEFKNVAGREREARAQIALPPGGVVSRVTLWVNGEEREAAFAGSGEVRAAYENVVKVYRRDPILVTQAGDDRVLMQCYPVPPNGGTIKVRLGITAPVELESASTAILRWPRFLERNFAVPDSVQHSVWVESPQALNASHPKLAIDHTKPGKVALRGLLKESELADASALVRIPRSPQVRASWVADPHDAAEGRFVRQELQTETPARPGRIVLVVDGSKSMDELMPVVAGVLPQLPEGAELSVLIARDVVEEFSGPVRKADAGWLRDLSARLAREHGAGGQDNLDALVRAWDLASERTNSVVLWIHGPQPVELTTSERLHQRVTWRTALADGGPRFHDLQVVPGPNRVLETFSLLAPMPALPRFGSAREDLLRLFALWRGEGSSFRWLRQRLPQNSMAETERGTKSSKHLARLWAKDEVGRLVSRRQRDEAVKLAAAYQLVTSVSGAVVLENRQQFTQAGLTPVDPTTVPVVPEPGVLALLLAGVAVAAAGAQWRKKRPDRHAV